MMTGREIEQIILNETLTMIPGKDLKFATTYDYQDEYENDKGVEKLFTSDKLKENFKKLISTQRLLNPGLKNINDLIDKELIIPVFASKSFLSVLSRKIFAPKDRSNLSGFYSMNVNKIFIMMENNTSFLFFSKDEQISSVLLHELQHFASYNFQKDFINIHKNTLIKFYNSLFDLTFQINLKDDDCFELVKWIYFNVEKTGVRGVAVLVKYAEYLESLFLKYVNKNDPIIEKISSFLSVLKLYLENLNYYVQALQRGDKNVVKVYINLVKSYKKLGIYNLNSLCIQELWAPSEVVCIESQYKTTSKHFQLLTKLKNLK